MQVAAYPACGPALVLELGFGVIPGGLGRFRGFTVRGREPARHSPRSVVLGVRADGLDGRSHLILTPGHFMHSMSTSSGH